jgi:hypothetical protein
MVMNKSPLLLPAPSNEKKSHRRSASHTFNLQPQTVQLKQSQTNFFDNNSTIFNLTPPPPQTSNLSRSTSSQKCFGSNSSGINVLPQEPPTANLIDITNTPVSAAAAAAPAVIENFDNDLFGLEFDKLRCKNEQTQSSKPQQPFQLEMQNKHSNTSSSSSSTSFSSEAETINDEKQPVSFKPLSNNDYDDSNNSSSDTETRSKLVSDYNFIQPLQPPPPRKKPSRLTKKYPFSSSTDSIYCCSKKKLTKDPFRKAPFHSTNSKAANPSLFSSTSCLVSASLKITDDKLVDYISSKSLSSAKKVVLQTSSLSAFQPYVKKLDDYFSKATTPVSSESLTNPFMDAPFLNVSKRAKTAVVSKNPFLELLEKQHPHE